MGTILLALLLVVDIDASTLTNAQTVPGRASGDPVRVSEAAIRDWRGDSPDIAWDITADALPAPLAGESASRTQRTGCEVVRLRFRDGHPTGSVLFDNIVWGRPVGLTVIHDGSAPVSEDGKGTIRRTAFRASR